MSSFDREGEKLTETSGDTHGTSTQQSPSVLTANRNASQLALQAGGGSDEQVLVLEASTSTTKVAPGMDLFSPKSQYGVTLSQQFFNELASPTGLGFLDLAKPTGAAHGDVLRVDGKALEHKQAKGKAAPSSTTFVVSSIRGASPEVRQATNNVALEASGNGMLILARLVSAYLSALQSGALKSNPARLKIYCHVTMDADPHATDGQSRKETFLTTEPHGFNPLWNGVANAIMNGLLGAYGFKDDVMPNYMGFSRFLAITSDSARAYADEAQKQASGRWKDSPWSRTFVDTPLASVSDAIMACAAARAPKALTGAPDQDAAPSAVGAEGFGTASPAEWRGQYNRPEVRQALIKDRRAKQIPAGTINPGVKAKILADAQAVGEKVLAEVLPLVVAGIGKALPPELASYAPLMAERWTNSIKDGLANVRWWYWYDLHFQVTEERQAAPSTASVSTGTVANEEGVVNNALRVHKAE